MLACSDTLDFTGLSHMHGWLYADVLLRLQRSALERMAALEDENAALKEAAQRRSAVLQQSRSFITSYLEVSPVACFSAMQPVSVLDCLTP